MLCKKNIQKIGYIFYIRVQQAFSTKVQMVSIFGFVGLTVNRDSAFVAQKQP